MFFSTASSTDGKYASADLQKVEYIKLRQEDDTSFRAEAYAGTLENGELLENGTFFLAASVNEAVAATMKIEVINIITENDAVVEASKKSEDPFPYMRPGKVGDTFSLAEMTDFSEFYYGSIDNPASLVKCDTVKIAKAGDGYKLLPVDGNGNAVPDTNVYMVYDHQYKFNFTLNSIVNEHGEDNGDVYLWKGTKAYKRQWWDSESENEPQRDPDFEALNGETDVVPKTKTLTGHIGDSFTAEELGELLIYVATGAKRTFNMGWHDLGGHPTDGGWRGYTYLINNYITLNSFKDKVDYFEIVQGNAGEVYLQAVMPGGIKVPCSPDNADFYVTRRGVARSKIWNDIEVYHVQLRMPSNVMFIEDGVPYSGTFELQEAYVTANWQGKTLINNAQCSIGDVDAGANQQEAAMSEFKDDNGRRFNIPFQQDLFDASKMQITVTFKVSGKATGENGKIIEYTAANPLEVTQTLTSEQLKQAYDACPNRQGYDVMLDLTAALKNNDDNTSKIILTKIWDDDSNIRGVRPESISVELERSLDGVSWAAFEGNTVTLTGGKTAAFWETEVPTELTFEKGQDGKITPYKFRITGESFESTKDYEAPVIDGTTIKNKLKVETGISITKQWKDADGNEITNASAIPGEIDFAVYQDGKYYVSVEISGTNNWQAEVTGLPVYRGNTAEKYEYTFYELDENGKRVANGQLAEFGGKYYVAEISEKSDDDSITVINKEIKKPKKTEVTPNEDAAVKVGEEIAYTISYQNYQKEAATVTIRDTLDENVEYVSAGQGGSYDTATHTVTWTLETWQPTWQAQWTLP